MNQEEKEQLFQRKLKEMANIGVKKRTKENTPDFDDPIDLDDDLPLQNNSTSTSEKNKEDAAQEIELLATEEIPSVQSSKRKKGSKNRDNSVAKDFSEYEQRFLITIRNGRNKSGFSIHTEVLQMLRNVLNDLHIETSITGYIENIILDHLRTYQDLLNDIGMQRRRNKTIDL